MLTTLLSLDQALLASARHLVTSDSAKIIQLLGELIVFWGAFVLIGLWLYGIYKKNIEYKYTALKIFFLIVFVFVIYSIINFGVPQWRPSPQSVVGGIAPLIPHPMDNSFPSGHALFSAALIVGLWKYMRNGYLLSITVIFALVTAVSRIIGGVHYPGDILGGFILGGIGAIFLAKVVEKRIFEKNVFPMLLRIAGWIKL